MDMTTKLVINAVGVFGVLVLFYRYKAGLMRVVRRKRQRQAGRIVELLKNGGHEARVCPECKGKGETHYFSWRLDAGRECAACDGLGYSCKIKPAKD
jgi:hypothetical protein